MTKIRVKCCGVSYDLPFTAHKAYYVLRMCGKQRSNELQKFRNIRFRTPLIGFSETPDKRQHFNKDRASILVNRIDHNNGKILSTMEWSMVFVKVPLQLMVFQWFFHNWTIAIE